MIMQKKLQPPPSMSCVILTRTAFSALVQAESLLGARPVGQPVLGDGRDADAGHVRLEAGVEVLTGGEGVLGGGALVGHVPGAAAEVVLVVLDEGQHLVLLGVVRVRGDAGDLVLELRERLRVLEVEVEHLHVGRALARAARRHVVLELEVYRLERRQREHGGDLARLVEPVLGHGVGEQGTGLLGRAALGRLRARLGVGRNLGDDVRGASPIPGSERGGERLAGHEKAGSSSNLVFHDDY